jgi:hypothetical protein
MDHLYEKSTSSPSRDESDSQAFDIRVIPVCPVSPLDSMTDAPEQAVIHYADQFAFFCIDVM